MRSAIAAAFAFCLAVMAQAPVPRDYVCPMDPDVRSATPGTCPRCGMKLVLEIPDAVEYPMELKTDPPAPRAGAVTELVFRVRDPHTGKQVDRFQMVHEKLFHMFIVSQDLSCFVHGHPIADADGSFRFRETFPKPGLYRVGGDFYPEGGAPHLAPGTVIVAGANAPLAPAHIQADLTPKQSENLSVELITEPAQPIAGMKTLLFFRLAPADGLEKYLGAWGHMLAVSDDLIDMIHTHPFIAGGGPEEQFNLIFPRARVYRIWVQFERKGVVNTAAFNVPVTELR